MFEYIFTIGCFDKLHKGHIKLLESIKKHTDKIIVGLHDNNSIKKLKNISDVYSYDDRKRNLEKYAYDVFKINDADPTKAIQEYISKNFRNLVELDRISNSTIHQNKGKIKLPTDNFTLYGVTGNYLSQENYRKYNSNIIALPIGSRAKHFYQDNEYRIYNERDKIKDKKLNCKYGTLVYSIKNAPYKCEEFNSILNNNTNCGGSEDNRYIFFKNELFVVFNGISKKDNSRQMFLYNLKKSKICQLYINSYDIRKITQKNWMPYAYKDNLYFIYSICDLCVLKLNSFDSGECEIVFGHPSKFTNKGLFGGSNLCHWKDNLYIGFIHSRNPHLCMPFLYDANSYKYISTNTSIEFNLPFKINHKISCGTEEYPYYLRKISNKYELFLSYQVIVSIKFEINTNAIDDLFTNLLKYNPLESITIGPSQTNSKVIKSQYTGNLFFIHKYKDTFNYCCKDNNIIVTRTDNNCGWGQNLIGYKKNWCFVRADNKKNNFPGIDFIKSIMPIQYIPYSNEISASKLRDFKNNKLGVMNYLLHKVVDIMNEKNIPYYLDCGTLLGCIRENGLMEKDTDIDVTIHLSYWDKLNGIDFNKYGLKRTRTRSCKKKGYIISLKTEYSKLYCDIYANPAFPQLDTKILNGKSYNIPLNSDLYLTQLYGNWKIPSTKHADWPRLFYGNLINGPYSKYWDKDFEIKLDPRPVINIKNLNKYFWNSYYKSNNHNINNQSTFAEFVYENYCTDCKYLLDLGCGNCRDSIFFSKKDIEVDAIDYNGHIDKDYHNLTFIKKDVELFLKEKNLKPYNLVYMRWFLHAMPYDSAEEIFKLSCNVLDKGGTICIEVRSINDNILIKNSIYNEEDFSYKTTHKRWLYSIPRLEKLIAKYNMKKITIEEGYFSYNKNTETANPLIIRCIIEKA